MSRLRSEGERRAAEVCLRLRAIQGELADADASTRRAAFADEIKAALPAVPGEQRGAFLTALRRSFPTADMAGVRAGGGEELSSADSPDPRYHARRLCELAEELTDEQRQAVGAELEEAGLTRRAPAADASAAEARSAGGLSVERIVEQLRLPAKPTGDAQRLQELLLELVEHLLVIEQVVRDTWGYIRPSDGPQLGRTLRLHLADAAGDRSERNLKKDLRRLRHVALGLVTANASIGSELHHHFFQALSPADIEQRVKDQGVPWFESIEVRCWRKYKALVGEMTSDAFDALVQRLIAEYVLSLHTQRRTATGPGARALVDKQL